MQSPFLSVLMPNITNYRTKLLQYEKTIDNSRMHADSNELVGTAH